MPINKTLRQLRMNSHMTQEQVAEKLGVTRQALSSYESGRTRPDVDTLLRLAEIYHTDMDTILYDQLPGLKAARRIRRIALALAALLLFLTVTSSALLWSSNRFFSLSPGVMTAEMMQTFETRQRLTGAWETLDSLILTLTLPGGILLLILLITEKCSILFKHKLLYTAVLIIGLYLLPLPFALTDAVYTPVNYMITPMLVSIRVLVFFFLSLFAAWLKKRQRRKTTD